MFKFRFKISKLVILSIIFILFVVPIAIISNASNNSTVGFYVSANIPDNQIDKSQTYFDLLVKPNAKQTLTVTVVNEENEELRVDIQAISASTNRNGIIDYKTKNIKDETLKYSFSEIANIENKEVIIPPKGSKNVAIDIQMFKDEFDGVVLGGIVITKKKPEKDKSTEPLEKDNKSSIIIENEYSYVVGVKLTMTDKEIEPDFKLQKIKTEMIDYRAAIVHFIQNPKPNIIKGMDISLNITNLKNNEKYLSLNKTVDMAPNSTMELPVFSEENKLESGEYKSKVVVSYDEETWEFEKEFIIKSEEAKDINKSVIDNKDGMPIYIWIIIFMLGITIILLSYLLIKKGKIKKNN